MKIRNGFVSNSSSSSFIVAFPEIPYTTGETHDMMFSKPITIQPYDFGTSSFNVADQVFRDIDKQEPITREKAIEILTEGYVLGQPEYESAPDDLSLKEKIEHYDKYEEKLQKWAEKEFDQFVSENPNAVIFNFKYSDNDGDFSVVMEHGEIFHELPHIQVCNH